MTLKETFCLLLKMHRVRICIYKPFKELRAQFEHSLFHCPNEHYNRQQTMIPACRLLLLSIPPSKKDIASNELLFYSLHTSFKKLKQHWITIDDTQRNILFITQNA